MDIETALIFTDALVFAQMGTHLSDLQQAMLRESLSWQRQSYDQIADTYGYSATYLKHDVGPKLWKLLSEALGEKVNKTNFRAAIERRWEAENRDRESKNQERRDQENTGQENRNSLAEMQNVQPTIPEIKQESVLGNQEPDRNTLTEDLHENPKPASLTHAPVSPPRVDWGDAIDVSFFYGREPELAQLTEWIVVDRCRLIAVLGIGGMGKTSLSVKLAQRLVEVAHNSFEFVIWRSLRNAPPIQEILTELLHGLSDQPEKNEPETVSGKISRLMQILRSQRCLLILDNVEILLQENLSSSTTSPGRNGNYCQGYEAYGELFRQIGETVHQSCLVLTSREKVQEVALLEGEVLPVRSLRLNGLPKDAGQQLCQLRGSFQASDAEWDKLIATYSGNPLALKLISTTIQALFDGDVSEFLKQDTFVFGNVRSLIAQQFERLSAAEKSVMYWLAIYREPVSFSELRSDLFPTVSSPALIEVLELLEQRSLIEKTTTISTGKSTALFTAHTVVIEYATDRLIAQICDEIQAAPATNFSLLKTHALLKAQAKDYIRESQIRLIVQPVIDRLLTNHFTSSSIDDRLLELLGQLKNKSSLEVGYAGGNLLNLLCQQKTCLRNYDFSHLIIWQAYLQNVSLHHVNFSHSDLTHSIFAETLGIVFSVAFSPDGAWFATGDAEGGLRLWQAIDGKLLLHFAGHRGWVWSVVFSSNGRWLASCSSDKTIRVWDTETGQCLQTLQGHTSSIWCIAFSPHDHILASGGDEPIVKLWDVDTGECRQELIGHTGRILSVAFSPDGQTLATSSDDGTVRLWQIPEGECHSVYTDHTNRVWSIAFSHHGRWLVSGSADRTIKLWDISSRCCLQTWQGHGDRVRSVAFSPDDRTVASSSDDQTLRLWQIDTGQCLHVLRGHSNSIFSVSYQADGQTLVSGSADQTVKFWQVATGRCLKTLKGYTNSVFSVAFSPDGQTLASGSTDRTIRVWDVNTGHCLKTLQGHQGWVTSVAFYPQGNWLASSSADQTVRLWSTRTGQCLKVLAGHTNWVQSVAFSSDGERLASGGDDRTIRLWSVSTGQLLNTLTGHSDWIWAVTFSPNGELLASSSEDQTICLWSVHTGKRLRTLDQHRSRIKAVAFSPDGQLLASGSDDETVRLWSLSTGKCLHVLQGHENNVWSVAFSPDGAILASGSLDQTVRLWDIRSGNCLRTLPILNHSVRSTIVFSPIMPANQSTLATGSHQGTVQIWDLQTGDCLQTFVPDRPYQGTNISQVAGLTPAQKTALVSLGAIELEATE